MILWEHLPIEASLSSSSSSFFLRLEIGEFRTTFVSQMTYQGCDLDFKLTSDLIAHLSSNAHRLQFFSIAQINVALFCEQENDGRTVGSPITRID
jgi:hypothetical protein